MFINYKEVQNNLDLYIKFAQFEDIIVTKNDKNVAVIKGYRKRPKDDSIVENAEAYCLEDDLISYQEFLKLSYQSEKRYEFIDDEVYQLASPVYEHQKIAMDVSVAFFKWFDGKKCRPLFAPFDVTLYKSKDNINVVQPDILVICDTENINEKGKYTGIPALVIEILSSSTRKKDLIKKLDLYGKTGVSEYWIIDPLKSEVYIYNYKNKEITEYKIYKKQEIAKSFIFKGLEIELEQIFKKSC